MKHLITIGALAFALTWFLKEIPWRGTRSTPSRPAPPHAYSKREDSTGGS